MIDTLPLLRLLAGLSSQTLSRGEIRRRATDIGATFASTDDIIDEAERLGYVTVDGVDPIHVRSGNGKSSNLASVILLDKGEEVLDQAGEDY